MAPPRKNASTLHGILRRLHADRFRTFDLVRPPLQQHGRALLRSRLPTGRTFSKLAALGGDLWSDFRVGKRRSGDVVAGGLVSICEEWESDSDDCADYCLSVDDLCGLYVEFSSPLFFSFFGWGDMLLLGGVGKAGILMLMLMVKSRCSGNRRHFCCESNAGFGIMAAISASSSDSKVSVRSSRQSTGGGRHPFIPVRGTNR